MHPIETLSTALRYPWDDGDAGVTLVVGGILTLLSPLVVPALLVIGYGLRVVRSVMDDAEAPPRFDDWRRLLRDGVMGAVVLLVIVVLPLAVAAAVFAAVSGAAGVRFPDGLPVLVGGPAVGGLFLALVLLLAGLALVVAYLAPAAIVQLARTRRLAAAFDRDDVRELVSADIYGSAWLLAVVVFAATTVVLAVLNAAGIGVILSGFVSFYAFVAVASLFGRVATEAGLATEAVEVPAEPAAQRDPDA